MALTNPVITEKVISEENPKQKDNTDSLILTSTDDIRSLLKNIYNKHSLLSVIIDPYDEYFGSTIIEINNDENYLVIDELYPKEGHDKIEVGTQLSFNTQYSGAFVNFSGKIEAIGKNDKAAYYKINMPEKVEYHQRRNTYRIAISIKETIPVNLVNEDEVLIKAELRDISHGGLCLRFNGISTHVSIKGGDYIPTCIIQVDDSRKILSSLNICHVETIEETGTIRVGAEFAQISKIDQRELEHFIASLERSIIQKIKRTDKNSLIN